MAKSITMIPQTRNIYTAAPFSSSAKRKVAGYARVSTDSDEQFTIYEAQVDYYTNFIQSRPEWEFVKVYTDAGISGVDTKHRDGFNEMVADALAGKIDLIVTKSVSRFARNTVDSLVTIRKLKDNGCECYFEKENIYTFDGKGELLLTIMSSLAQEESRSISENTTWGQRKRFADGKVSIPYKHFLGYEKGPDGIPTIVPHEAEVVRLIYRLFMDDKTTTAIKHELEARGIPSPSGSPKWYAKTIESILKNEKYKGDALLQKSFTIDFLTKKMKPNNGEVPQYYVKESHPGIVTPDEFDAVQAEFDRRKSLGRSYTGNNALSSHIVCGDCGAQFGMRVWHSNDPYRSHIFQCNRKFKGEKKCQTPHLKEPQIHQTFLTAYNTLLQDRQHLIDDCRMIQATLADTEAIDRQIDSLTEEMEVVSCMVKEQVMKNAATAENQEEYEEKRAPLVQRFERLRAQREKLIHECASRKIQGNRIQRFIETLDERPLILEEWDEELWLQMVNTVTVHSNRMLVFHFRIGKDIQVKLPRMRRSKKG